MQVDWSLRLSDVLVIGGFLGTMGMMMFRAGAFAAAIKAVQHDIRGLQTASVQIASAITQIAVQKNDIDHLREDLIELKHGRGFVREAVEREYK